MCGGLQAAFQSSENTFVVRSQRQASLHLLLLNVGRITTYVLLGAIFTTLGYGVIATLNLNITAYWMRVVAAALIIVIGFQLIINNQRPFQFLEPLGLAGWKKLNQYISMGSSQGQRIYINGMIWGLLPCGLVYSVMLTSVFSGSLQSTVLVMLGFGLGTLPSMLLTGMAFMRFREYLKSKGVRYIGGLFFMLGGLLMLTAPYWVSQEFINDYPVLLNSVFCLTE